MSKQMDTTMVKSDVTGEYITCAEYVAERDALADKASLATEAAIESLKNDPCMDWVKDL